MSSTRMTMRMTLLEAAHLSDLVGQLQELLAAGAGSDPAVRRLVPDAYRDDPEASAEFRGLTQADLLARRAADAGTVRASLRHDGGDLVAAELDRTQAEDVLEVELDREVSDAWLRTLAALRLVMAERLGVTDEEHRDDDPRFGVYEWLGYRLEGLLQALDQE